MLLGFGAIFGGVYRGSFRIDFLGFGSYFSVCFYFFGIFWVFSVRFWVFFCADCSGVLSGFFGWVSV